MRILLANPNTTVEVTDRLVAAGRAVAAPGTEIVPMTAPRGFPYLSSRAEEQIGGAVVLEMLAAAPPPDAAIVAAFGDPGLAAARELFDFPVVGMAEAAMLLACTLGRRFALVTFATALANWFEECVAANGLTGRCAGVRALAGSFRSISDVAEEKEALLVDLANRAVRETDAEVVILSGAPLAGLASRIADRVPVPLVDPIGAAVKMAEALVALGPLKARAGAFARPPAKASIGIDGPLADRIAGR